MRALKAFAFFSILAFGAPPLHARGSSVTPPSSLRLCLDWYPSAEFAGVLVAIDKGWYRDAGLEVRLGCFGHDVTSKVLSGKSDIGIVPAAELISEIGRGKRLKAFAAHFQFSPQTIVVRDEKGMEDLKNLRGKVLGISDRFDNGLYEVMLHDAGLKLTDVKFLKLAYPTEPELLQLLKNKKMDAFIAWEFDWPVSFAMGKYPVRQFPSYQHHYHFYGDVYFARTDYLQSHRKALATFLKVTRRGWDEVYRFPAKYVQEIVQRWYPPAQYLEHSQSVTHREQLIELRLSKRFIFDGIPEDQYGQMSNLLWTKSLQIAREFGMVPAASPLTPTDLYERDVLDLSIHGKVR